MKSLFILSLVFLGLSAKASTTVCGTPNQIQTAIAAGVAEVTRTIAEKISSQNHVQVMPNSGRLGPSDTLSFKTIDGTTLVASYSFTDMREHPLVALRTIYSNEGNIVGCEAEISKLMIENVKNPATDYVVADFMNWSWQNYDGPLTVDEKLFDF